MDNQFPFWPRLRTQDPYLIAGRQAAIGVANIESTMSIPLPNTRDLGATPRPVVIVPTSSILRGSNYSTVKSSGPERSLFDLMATTQAAAIARNQEANKK